MILSLFDKKKTDESLNIHLCIIQDARCKRSRLLKSQQINHQENNHEYKW